MPFGGALTLGISAGSNILGGVFGGKAAKKAAKAQSDAALKALGVAGDEVVKGKNDIWEGQGMANQELTDAEKQQLQLLAPYISTGSDSLASLKDLAGPGGPLTNKFSFTADDYKEDPGYQFALQQGQKAIQNAAASKGNLFSSGTMKSIAGYTTGTANQYFGDAFNRAKTTFDENQNTALSRISTLQGLAGMGYNATGTAVNATGSAATQRAGIDTNASQVRAQLGQSYSNTAGNLLTNKGNSEAAGVVGKTNSWMDTLGGVTNSVTDYLKKSFPSKASSPASVPFGTIYGPPANPAYGGA